MPKTHNKVQLLGRVGGDVEILFAEDKSTIANFHLATLETVRDKQGDEQELVVWHHVVALGKLAEIIQQYISAGDKLFIEGKIRNKMWTDSLGQDRYSSEILIEDGDLMVILDVHSQAYEETQPNQNKAHNPFQPPANVPDFGGDCPFY